MEFSNGRYVSSSFLAKLLFLKRQLAQVNERLKLSGLHLDL